MYDPAGEETKACRWGVWENFAGGTEKIGTRTKKRLTNIGTDAMLYEVRDD